MQSIVAVVLASVTTFAATNVDDLVVLTLFSARRVPTRTVILGQYLGFAAIIGLSLVGFLAAIFVPNSWLRLLGLVPLAIGIQHLIAKHPSAVNTAAQRPSTLSVAALTIANCGDSIGVYVPFFAVNRGRLGTVLIVFAALLPFLCLIGKLLGNHPLVLFSLERYGHYIVPLVFIGLGVYILTA